MTDLVIVTAAQEPSRVAALRAIAGADAPLLDRLPANGAAVLLDARGAAIDDAAVERLAARGATVVVVDAGPGPAAGLVVGDPEPGGEAVLVALGHPTTRRAPGELVVDDAVRPLRDLDGARAVMGARLRFRDEVVVATRAVGAGHVVVAGVGSTPALRDERLAGVLRRLLRGPQSAGAAASGTVGVGVLGYGPPGGMGQRHGRALEATDGLALVAAADADEDRRKGAEADFAGIAVCPDVDGLLDDDAVDLVVVATPPVSHAGLVRRCLEAGRHVVVEKPMCLTTDEADGLLDLADAVGRTLTVHQNRRWDPDFRAVRRAVTTGMLGEVFNVETFVGEFAHPCRAWHSEASVSGGAVYDWGSHHIDWIVQLMGSAPRFVTATAHTRVWHDVTNADQVRVHMTWDDGREAQFVQSDVAAVARPKLYVQGSRGTLVGSYRPVSTERVDPVDGYVRTDHHHAEAPATLRLARHEPGWGITGIDLPALPAPAHAFHAALAAHLLDGDPPPVEPLPVRDVVAVLEASVASAAANGARIEIEPRWESTPAHLAAW